MSKLDEDKGIVYCNRVLIGNWYESAKLEEYKLNKFLEQMKKGDLMLARFRKMSENLNKPTVLTQSSSSIEFGAKISLIAPHVPATDPPTEDKKGLLLGGRISSNEINYSQELEDGCNIVGLSELEPAEKNTFILTSADYCNREGEPLKFNQEFLLALSSSVDKKKPLYVRYDPNPVPGLCGMFPLYLSRHPVSNTRWRILPVQGPNITRFEQEGKPVQVYEAFENIRSSTHATTHTQSTFECAADPHLVSVVDNVCQNASQFMRSLVNTDIVINHCATNANLGINIGHWAMGFYGKVCAPLMKTCLDVYGKELPNNIWQIYIPIAG